VDKTTDAEAKIRDYIVRNLMLKKSGVELGLDQPLLESGIMTSFGIVELVSYLESSFGIQIDDYDIVPENFQSVRTITKLVELKRG
jgi:acyl carrier protein